MMNRRTFLKIAGMGSLAFTTACTLESEKKLYSLVHTPDDQVTGKAHWYASTCRECPAGCGVLAKNREGRVIKLEGNPLHPVNQGRLCMRGQAALQGVYNPDRLPRPLVKTGGKWESVSYDEAAAQLKDKIDAATANGPNRVRLMSCLEGEHLSALFNECMDAWQSNPPFFYEPLACENLKQANAVVFGERRLPAYRMEESDALLSFGADFLETWLSPVAYARRFKAMHAYAGERAPGGKGVFYHISPCRSLTAANADYWLACPPGGEAAVCLGLIREMLARGRGDALAPAVRKGMETISDPYTPEQVTAAAGVSKDQWEGLVRDLTEARAPLVLGTGALSHSSRDLQANIAANLLNALLDPGLTRLDFDHRHRLERAGGSGAAARFFEGLRADPPDVLLLNQVNPVYAMPGGSAVKSLLEARRPYVVCFSAFMDETASAADLIIPPSLALEEWGEYSSGPAAISTLQPAMAPLTGAPATGDMFLKLLEKDRAKDRAKDRTRYAAMKNYLIARLEKEGRIEGPADWLQIIRKGGAFTGRPASGKGQGPAVLSGFEAYFKTPAAELKNTPVFLALPSLRFFDGRGANLPWLCEIPDPITKVAWQSPLMLHPDTAKQAGIRHGERVRVKYGDKQVSCLAYETDSVIPGVYALPLGQGHSAYGRYARGRGANPVTLIEPDPDPDSGALVFAAAPVALESTGEKERLAHTDGSIDQHGRKIALTTTPAALQEKPGHKKEGLAMWDFPLTLPLPEGYDRHRDFYPPHDHKDYRWAMVVDLDRCIGCNACAAACYAENNLGVVGEEEVKNGREMSWLHIERYEQIDAPERLIFLPMLCQHCDNAPCESVCPVYAPHHNKEGLNNQIYNRCIGTRFCAQNCPYKVRRFNWLDWQWPDPLNLQLNPDVTVRSKGVMEKCSFCIQRIKTAHDRAKNEGRMIRDGEVTPACVQTCPTGALVFGSLMDENSRVSRLARDPRAYQVMGYLNTKPAVIYLKKVVRA